MTFWTTQLCEEKDPVIINGPFPFPFDETRQGPPDKANGFNLWHETVKSIPFIKIGN